MAKIQANQSSTEGKKYKVLTICLRNIKVKNVWEHMQNMYLPNKIIC